MNVSMILRWLAGALVAAPFLFASYILVVTAGWSFQEQGPGMLVRRLPLLAIATLLGVVGIALARIVTGKKPLSWFLLGALAIPVWGAFAVLL